MGRGASIPEIMRGFFFFAQSMFSEAVNFVTSDTQLGGGIGRGPSGKTLTLFGERKNKMADTIVKKT